MSETTLLLAPERWTTRPAPDRAPLPAELAIVRRENTALRAENAALLDDPSGNPVELFQRA